MEKLDLIKKVECLKDKLCIDCEATFSEFYKFKKDIYTICSNCNQFYYLCLSCFKLYKSKASLSSHQRSHIVMIINGNLTKYLTNCNICNLELKEKEFQHIFTHYNEFFENKPISLKRKTIEINTDNIEPISGIHFPIHSIINDDNEFEILIQDETSLLNLNNFYLNFNNSFNYINIKYAALNQFDATLVPIIKNNLIDSIETYTWIYSWIFHFESEESIKRQIINIQKSNLELAMKIPSSFYEFEKIISKFLPPKIIDNYITIKSIIINVLTSQTAVDLIFDILPTFNGIITHFTQTEKWKECVTIAKEKKALPIAIIFYSDEFIESSLYLDGQKIRILNLKYPIYFTKGFINFKKFKFEDVYKLIYIEMVTLFNVPFTSNFYGSEMQYDFVVFPIIGQHADIDGLKKIGLQKKSNSIKADLFILNTKDKFSLVYPFTQQGSIDTKRDTKIELQIYNAIETFKENNQLQKAKQLITLVENELDLQFLKYPIIAPKKQDYTKYEYQKEMSIYNLRKKTYMNNLNNVKFPLFTIFNQISDNGRDLIAADLDHISYKNAEIYDHILLLKTKLPQNVIIGLNTYLLTQDPKLDLFNMKLWKMEQYHDVLYILGEILILSDIDIAITKTWILEMEVQKISRTKYLDSTYLFTIFNKIVELRNAIKTVYATEITNGVITFLRPKLAIHINTLEKIYMVGGYQNLNGLLGEAEWKDAKKYLSFYQNESYLLKRTIQKETLLLKTRLLDNEFYYFDKITIFSKMESINKERIELFKNIIISNHFDIKSEIKKIKIRGLTYAIHDYVVYFDQLEKKEKYGRIDGIYELNQRILFILKPFLTINWKDLLQVQQTIDTLYVPIIHGFPEDWIINHCRFVYYNDNLYINPFFY